MKKIFLTSLTCAILITSAVFAQIPNKISYQGMLTKSNGSPANGDFDLKFEIYNLPTGGTLRHTETHTGVSVKQGSFGVILGTKTLFTLAFNESLYVEVTALSGPGGLSYPLVFSPRSELTSAPYALRAKIADSLATGSGGTSWLTTGNAGTTAGTNFAGTTDAQSFDIRTDNTLRTRITTKGQIETYNTGQSVFLGEGAGANDDLNVAREVCSAREREHLL